MVYYYNYNIFLFRRKIYEKICFIPEAKYVRVLYIASSARLFWCTLYILLLEAKAGTQPGTVRATRTRVCVT